MKAKYSNPQYSFGGFLSGATSGAMAGSTFGPWGAVAGGVLGGVSSLLGESAAEKQRKEMEAARKKMEEEQFKMYSEAVMASNPTNGYANTSYYAYGGDMGTNPVVNGRAVVNRTKSYAWGGAVSGGILKPLASNASLVKGDTHSQDTNKDGKTGVTLNKAGVEVENQEVIIGDKVFSHRLGFAAPAKALALKRGELEKSIRPGSIFAEGSRKRELEKLDMDIANLFSKQEQTAKTLGLRNEGNQASYGLDKLWDSTEPVVLPQNNYSNPYGSPTIPRVNVPYALNTGSGETSYSTSTNSLDSDNEARTDWSKLAKKASWPTTEPPNPPNFDWSTLSSGKDMKPPSKFDVTTLAKYADNIGNYFINKNTPEIAQPVLNRAVPMNTNYNINPALANINNTMRAYSKDINSNVSNSAVGNANKAAFYAKAIGDKNVQYALKENTENQLKNINSRNYQDVYNANVGLQNKYSEDVYNRQLGVQQRDSANLANLAEDTTQAGIDKRLERLDMSKIDLITKANSLDNDAAARQTFEYLFNSGTDMKQYKSTLAKTKAGRTLWNKYYPTDPIKEV